MRDLIDLLLLAGLEPDLARVREACVDIFASRENHTWPPVLSAEPSWPEQYRALAREQGFAIDDLNEAVRMVRELIRGIDSTGPT